MCILFSCIAPHHSNDCDVVGALVFECFVRKKTQSSDKRFGHGKDFFHFGRIRIIGQPVRAEKEDIAVFYFLIQCTYVKLGQR